MSTALVPQSFDEPDDDYEAAAETSLPIRWARVLIVVALLLSVIALITPGRVHAHDWSHPELDNWYSSLMRPHGKTFAGGTSCCSKEDCHTTQSERRNGEWWARLGTPIRRQSGEMSEDWELGPWVQIPDEVIVRGPSGNPIPNEAGEAVICHSRGMVGNQIQPGSSTIYCFVPGNES